MPNRILDFDLGFRAGMFSGDDAEQLPRGAYVRSMNTVNRGGILQCRPGYGWRFNLPDGKLQGLTFFEPSSGTAQLVAAVDGKLYYSNAPFETYKQIPNVQFKSTSSQVFWAHCRQSVQRNADGSQTLITPKSYLIVQDGQTAAGYWDGSKSGHDKNIKVGTVMKWSGERLWVARRDRLFASDIGNPFSFFEGQYIGTTGSFKLPGLITGIAEVPNLADPFIFVFTATTTTQILSNIRVRSLWEQTPNFIQTVLPNIGCVSHKSIVAGNGLLWWFAQFGLTNFNAAFASKRDSALEFTDHNMSVSKGRLAPNLSGVCGAAFENYVLMSVPHADFLNRHTWVRDEIRQSPSWNSYWTGTRPVEWAVGDVGRQSRIFHASVDYDGVNRVWEAFGPDRMDNGCPITWTLETRAFTGGTLKQKQFRWAKLYMSELSDVVDMKVGWAGSSKGRYKDVLAKRIKSLRGTISTEKEVVFDKDDFALKKQTRTLSTEEQRMTDSDPLSACGVESDSEDWIDTGFKLCLTVNGPGAVRAVKIYMEDENEDVTGKCEPDETDERASRFDGADASGDSEEEVWEVLQAEDDLFTGISSVTAADSEGTTVVGTGTVESKISQQCADKMAKCVAEMRAAQQLKEVGRPFMGGFLA